MPCAANSAMRIFACRFVLVLAIAQATRSDYEKFEATFNSMKFEDLELLSAELPRVMNMLSRFAARAVCASSRFRHCVEFFGGAGGVTTKLRDLGFQATTFDFIMDSRDDFCVLGGLMWAVWLVMTLLPGGVVIFEPTCSTWLNTCRYHTKRNGLDTAGNTERHDVASANFTAVVIEYMIQVSQFRHVHFILEQPLNSMLYLHIRETLLDVGAHRMVTNGGAFGFLCLKPFELWLTCLPQHVDLIKSIIVRSKSQAKAAHDVLIAAGKMAAPKKLFKMGAKKTHTKGWSKKGWVTGSKYQKQSQVHPERFQQALVDVVKLIVS